VPKKKPPKRRKPPGRSNGDVDRDDADIPTSTDAKIDAKDLTGLKFFRRVRPLLESLHGVGPSETKLAIVISIWITTVSWF